MIWTRYVPLVVVLFLSWSLVASTGGVSSASLNRGIDGTVVSDEEAYLGVEQECHNETLRVMIINQFSAGTVITVNVTVNGTTKTIDDLAVGESRMTVFEAVNTGNTVRISASGQWTSVRLTRTLPTRC